MGQTPTGLKGETARKALAAARQDFIVAMRRGDVAALVAHYDQDAIVVPQNSSVCRGRASIEKLFSSWLSSATVREFEAETEELRILDDVAFEVGTYRLVVEAAGSALVSDEGKFLMIYERKPHGTWLISRDMSSSSRR